MTTAVQKQTGAEQIRWDMSDLYSNPSDPHIDQDMEALREKARAFAEKYRGRVASLSAEEMLQALQETEDLHEVLARLGTFAYLPWTVDTTSTEISKLMAKTQQFMNEINQELLFFDLEWAQAPDDAKRIMDDEVLQHYRHYLETVRLYRDYTLSEPEEKIISELSISGKAGWNRYFGEVMSRLRFPFRGEQLTQSEILNKLKEAEREVRREAADSITEVLRDNAHTTTFVFNMILAEKASQDKMRGYKSWISSRNLSNQVEDETVEALVDAVTSRYDLVHRYYDLLRGLLGYDKLYDYDRYAPYETKKREVSWTQAQDIVLQAFGRFDERLADTAELFFTKNWIDAAPLPNKRGGAYSSYGSARHHPFVFMNYLGDEDSVMTLAHELGHGVHQYLAREQGELLNGTPLTTAEMASTFGEMLVFDSLMLQTQDPEIRLGMRISKIVDSFSTIYRQIAMNRFEDAIHNARRTQGELSTDDLSAFWMDTQRPMYGDAVELRDHYSIWWSYIPHFLGTPGYVYAYAFGELLVWALYAKYRQAPAGFADAYFDALRACGSKYPHEILKPLNVNLQDPQFWHEGLKLVENFIADTEAEAAALRG